MLDEPTESVTGEKEDKQQHVETTARKKIAHLSAKIYTCLAHLSAKIYTCLPKHGSHATLRKALGLSSEPPLPIGAGRFR